MTDCVDAWKKGALGVVNSFLAEPLKQSVVNVVGGGDQEWAVVELEANAKCKNGETAQKGLPPNLHVFELPEVAADPNLSGMEYPQRYSWSLRFNEHGIIVQVRIVRRKDAPILSFYTVSVEHELMNSLIGESIS